MFSKSCSHGLGLLHYGRDEILARRDIMNQRLALTARPDPAVDIALTKNIGPCSLAGHQFLHILEGL